MLINNGFTPIKTTGAQTPYTLSAVPRLIVPAPPQDILHISEEAQRKIDQLQQGNQSLQQAVTQSKQSIRGAAQERISSAREYLKILIRLSPAGDKGAAYEAARIAREVKSAANEFKASIAGEEGANVSSEIAAFVGVAGDVLKMARNLIESYLQKHSEEQKK